MLPDVAYVKGDVAYVKEIGRVMNTNDLTQRDTKWWRHQRTIGRGGAGRRGLGGVACLGLPRRQNVAIYRNAGAWLNRGEDDVTIHDVRVCVCVLAEPRRRWCRHSRFETLGEPRPGMGDGMGDGMDDSMGDTQSCIAWVTAWVTAWVPYSHASHGCHTVTHRMAVCLCT